MNVTVTHPNSSFTGNVTLQDGAVVLSFTNGTCQEDVPPSAFNAIAAAGLTLTIGAPSPAPPYDANLDPTVAAIVGASASQTTARLKAAYGAAAGFGALPKVPLNITTPDGNPACTHPCVVDTVALTGAPWNGYRYWMAFTPYPPSSRENPCIAASHNGTDWVIPTGVTNPVAPLADAQAAGLEFQSDPNMTLLNGTMYLFYRGYKSSATMREVLYLRTSTDGFKTVSAPTKLLDLSGNNNVVLSPAFIHETDGTWSVWAINDNNTGSARLTKYVLSADLSTMTGPTACTVTPTESANTDIWHLEVRKTADGTYHMLAAIKGTWTLVYLTSTDGVTWDGSMRKRITQTGKTFDTRGYYKSSFIPRPSAGGSIMFDVWATGLDNTGSDAWSDNHRIAFFPNVDFGTVTTNRLWLPASKMFSASLGTPTETIIQSRYPTMAFDASSGEGITTIVQLPGTWTRVSVTLFWTNLGAGTGATTWVVTTQPVSYGQQMASGATEVATSLTSTAPNQNYVKQDTVVSSLRLGADLNAICQLRVNRDASNAADTLANDAGLLGVLIQRLVG